MSPEREDLRPYVGPTPYCNWVIKDRVMAGGYPACLDDEENDELLTVLLRDMGIDTFVCLQSEVWPDVPDAAWRAGRAPRPYTRDIRRLMSSGRDALPNAKIDFLHLPIVDGSVTSDDLVDRFCDDLIGKVLSGRRLYVHCWGGHGRTGTIIAVMLGRMYDVTTAQALARTQQLHDVRRHPQNVGSPSTPVQVAQVPSPDARADEKQTPPSAARRRPRGAPQGRARRKNAAARPRARGGHRARAQTRGRETSRGGASALVLRGEFAAHARTRGRHADQAVAVRKRVVSFSSSRSSAKRCLVLLYCRVSETYVAPCDMRRMGRSCEHARA